MDQTPGPVPRPMARPASAGSLRVRVRYCECDPMGVAHHAAFIPWLEMGRTELLRDSGVSYADLEAAGVFLVIVKLEVSYKRPAYYDDFVEVRTRVIGGSRVKIRHEYEVVRASEPGSSGGVIGERANVSTGTIGALVQRRTPGEVLVTGQSLLACVDREGRPAGLPDWLVPENPLPRERGSRGESIFHRQGE
ncbi:MAG: acyl-CoA thioesterase [Phycisphaerales bacterium]|nr:acyl-CoA thioesterase [Phycisphaerales bacterium]